MTIILCLVYPILMSKGKTKVALYGLGNIRDERLYRTFAAGKGIFPSFKSFAPLLFLSQMIYLIIGFHFSFY
jgi:hypothetical protein